MRTTFLFVILTLLLTGCPYNPFAHKYRVTKPESSEVVGTYRISDAYLSYYFPELQKSILQNKTTLITLKSDGSFDYKDLPWIREVSTFKYAYDGLRSGVGKWSITTTGSVGSGSGPSKTSYGIQLVGLPEAIATPTLLGKNAITGVIFGFGDADQGEAIVLQKQ